MNNKLFLILAAFLSTCLPSLASASVFTGSFQATMYADQNIFDGPQLSNDTGMVTVSGGAGPSDLNLAFIFNSQAFSIPLVASGSLATLAPGTHMVGTATLLDTYLFSDGNNMSLASVAKDQSGSISYLVSAWQQSPSFATASDAVGQWLFTSVVGNPNLRSSAFHFESGWFNIADTGGSYAIVVPQVSLNVPLAISQGSISLFSAPAMGGSGQWEVLDWTYGQGRGALVIVGIDPNDNSDVSITVGLVTQAVPEPETYALLLAGLGLLGFKARRRKDLNNRGHNNRGQTRMALS